MKPCTKIARKSIVFITSLLLCIFTIFSNTLKAFAEEDDTIYVMKNGVINPEYADYITGSFSDTNSNSGVEWGYSSSRTFIMSDFFDGADITVTMKVYCCSTTFGSERCSSWYGAVQANGATIGSLSIQYLSAGNSSSGNCSSVKANGPTTFTIINYHNMGDHDTSETQWDGATVSVTDIAVRNLYNVTVTPNIDSWTNTDVVLTCSVNKDTDSYEWYKDGELIEEETDNVITVSEYGSYSCIGTSSKGLKRESSPVIAYIDKKVPQIVEIIHNKSPKKKQEITVYATDESSRY